jgi:large conductance mechanosensitive channel
LIGDFINALLSFIVLAAVVYYFVVVPVGKLLERYGPTPAAPVPTRECPECLSKIPAKARRCAFCTAVLVDEVDAAVSRITGGAQSAQR